MIGIPKGHIVGAQTHEDGRPNLSKALRVEGQGDGIEEVIEQARGLGITEEQLRNFSSQLASQAGVPIMRNARVAGFAQTHGLDMKAALALVRSYARERVRHVEQGDLHHYHQFPIEFLPDAAKDKALLSMNEQKARGKKFPSRGSRPDVVQMTRDHYGPKGILIKSGLGAALTESDDSITFVFNERVMDLEHYTCTGEYPDLPGIPLESPHLEAVLVNNADSIVTIQEMLRKNGISARVATRAAWREEKYN